MGIIVQVLSTLVLCYICLTLGIMFTWPSSTLRLFSSTNTTLNRPMNEGEISLFTSLSSFGALISTPVGGYFLDKIGRKKCAIISSIMSVIGWLLIAFSNRVEVILTAIFTSGLCTTIFTVNSVYISEICQDSIRGTMAASMMVFFGIGMLISYGLGGLLSYWPLVYTNLTITIVGTAALFLLKESPMYLMSIGLEKEAAESVAYYRRVDVNDKEVLTEMESIKRALNPELDDEPVTNEVKTPEEEKLNPDAEEQQVKQRPKKLPLIQFLKKSQSTRRGLIICLILTTASIFQGLPVVQVYAEPLFSEAVPNMSTTVCTIVFALIMVLTGFVGAFLVQSYGRKPLMVYGSIASGISNLLLGSQLQLKWGPNWLTAVIIYVFSIAYSLGAGTVPYVIIMDIFLPEVKSFANMVLVEWMWLCNFLILLVFTPLISALGLGATFYIFAGCCFLTAIFSYFFQPETKGLPVDEVQILFMSQKRRQSRLASMSS